MPETNQITFTYQELAEALVKRQGIHEGLWGVIFEFGLSAANLGNPAIGDVTPVAIVPLLKVGIQRFPQPSNLTVDASAVNPPPKPPDTQTKKRTQRSGRVRPRKPTQVTRN